MTIPPFTLTATNDCGVSSQTWSVTESPVLAVISSATAGASYSTTDGTTWTPDPFWNGRVWFYSATQQLWFGRAMSAPNTVIAVDASRSVVRTWTLPTGSSSCAGETASGVVWYVGQSMAKTLVADGSMIDHGVPPGSTMFTHGTNLYVTGSGALWRCGVSSATWIDTGGIPSGELGAGSGAVVTGSGLFNYYRNNPTDPSEVVTVVGSTLTTIASPVLAGGSAAINQLVFFPWCSNNASLVVCACANNGFDTLRSYRSANGGASWTDLVTLTGRATMPSWNQRLGAFVTADSRGGGTAWRKSSDGATWSVIASVPYSSGQAISWGPP